MIKIKITNLLKNKKEIYFYNGNKFNEIFFIFDNIFVCVYIG